MKLLLPFKVGDIVRTNYKTGPYRIVAAEFGCTCGNYVEVINNLGKKICSEPHWHFMLVDADEPPTKTGTYHDSKLRWLNRFIYRNGECVSVDGPHEKWMTGWHKEDDGWDKIKLVRLAPAGISKLTKPKIQPTTTECDDEE